MNYIIKQGFKIVGMFYILLAVSLVGCAGEGGDSTTGTGKCHFQLQSDEDINGNTFNCTDTTDNSVEAAPVE